MLSEVVRHQGSVLALAAAIREASEDLQQTWPKGSPRADDSAVVVHPFLNGWMEAEAKLHRLTLEPIAGQRTGVVTSWADLPKRIRRIPAEQGDQRRRALAG